MRQKAIHPDLLVSLKKELEYCFGRKIISYRDCTQLVEDIEQKTGFSVNVNTIRRFFGLVKTQYTASASTLSIFSKYCGFNSIDDLAISGSQQKDKDSVGNKEVLRYLVALYENLPVKEEYIHIGCSIVEETVELLERNVQLIAPFQREIAKLPAGQFYYYEKMVNLDRLNGYFGEGLRYYLRSKNTPEARLFVNALYCIKAFQAKNSAVLEKYYKLLLQASSSSHQSPSHLLAWKVAAQVYHSLFFKKSIDDSITDAIKNLQILTERRKAYLLSVPDYELLVAGIFSLSKQPEEGVLFFKHAKEIIEKKEISLSPYFKSVYNIFQNYLDKSETSYYTPKRSDKSKALITTSFNKRILQEVDKILTMVNLQKFK